jgi:hypothetical protein
MDRGRQESTAAPDRQIRERGADRSRARFLDRRAAAGAGNASSGRRDRLCAGAQGGLVAASASCSRASCTTSVLRLRINSDVLGAWPVAGAIWSEQARPGASQVWCTGRLEGTRLGGRGWAGHEPSSDDRRHGQNASDPGGDRQYCRARARAAALCRDDQDDAQPSPDAELGHRVGLLRPALEYQALAAELVRSA